MQKEKADEAREWLTLYLGILASGYGANTGANKADAALKQYRKRYGQNTTTSV